MYSNLTWLDHAVTPDRTFTITDNGDGTVTLTPYGTVIQQGTNMSAANFNNMEMGITDVDLAVHILALLCRDLDSRESVSEDDIEEIKANILAEITPEEKTITLTNSAAYPFNNSAVSVSLSTNRATKNYTVEAEVADADGNVGEIEITDKTLNGFKVAFTGSAATATINLKIRGGILA